MKNVRKKKMGINITQNIVTHMAHVLMQAKIASTKNRDTKKKQLLKICSAVVRNTVKTVTEVTEREVE